MPWIKRQDSATSAVIDRAVQVLATDGEYFAAAYLAHHGMSPSSIVRIISGRHRSAEQDASSMQRSQGTAPHWGI
ncbi:MAG: hypothetical protein WKG03_02070 [Telluria sp.]